MFLKKVKLEVLILLIALLNTNTYAYVDERGLAIVGNSHAYITSMVVGIDSDDVGDPNDFQYPHNAVGGGKLDVTDENNEKIYHFIDVADKYDKAVIYLGTNELNFSATVFYERYVDYINKILEKNPDIKIILISVPYKNEMNLKEERIKEWNDIIEYIAALYENVYMYHIEESDEELLDVVHLTYDSYKKILDKAVNSIPSAVINRKPEIIVGPGVE